MTWPSDTTERSVLVTVTYKFRYSGSEYVPVINDDTGQWPKYSYSINAAPALPGLGVPPPADIAVPVPDQEETIVRFYNPQAEPFIVPANVTNIELVVIGAGGGGGIGAGGAGGGGAGGFFYSPSFSVRAGGVYTITVGEGGRAGAGDIRQFGGNSEFILTAGNAAQNEKVICKGGGAGANGSGSQPGNGASGGGCAGTVPVSINTPGTNYTNPVNTALPTTAQGTSGGIGKKGRGGGGGGAGGAGEEATGTTNGNTGTGGAGGPGVRVAASSTVLTNQMVCAGGAGGADNNVDNSGPYTYTQPADPWIGLDYGTNKYGNGGGASKNGSVGLVAVAYRQKL
jgi:hypothetical protein